MNGDKDFRQKNRGIESKKKHRGVRDKPGFTITEIDEATSTSQMQQTSRNYQRKFKTEYKSTALSAPDSCEVLASSASQLAKSSQEPIATEFESCSDDSASSDREMPSSAKEKDKSMKRKHLTSTTDSQGEDSSMVVQVVEAPSVAFKSVGPKKFKVLLSPGAKLYFYGKLSVKVVEGQVQVLGWTMQEGEERQVFSPFGSSLLGLENVGLGNSTVLLQPLDSHLASALHKLVQEQLFSSCRNTDLEMLPAKKAKVQAERSLHCKFYVGNSQSSGRKFTLFGDDWKHVVQKISHGAVFVKKSCTVVAGGKGVGKSTLLRVLANQTLGLQAADCRGVLVVDLDPGQAEFTAPGCLSATLVSSPLTGPGYTQQRTPQRTMFLGHVDVNRCQFQFVDAVEELLHFCIVNHPTVPWLVNTMGYNTGLGEELMRHVLKLLGRGVQVVELRSRLFRKNFSPHLWASEVDVNHHFSISCMAEDPQGACEQSWGLMPRELREISLLAYLSPALHPPSFSIGPCEPFKIPLELLTLGQVRMTEDRLPASEILRVLNGSLVGLCLVGPQAAVHTNLPNGRPGPRVLRNQVTLPCVGYGVVTGVDIDEGRLYLQTPEPLSRLAEVNCLLLGVVELPLVLRTAGALPGRPVPYVSMGKVQPRSSPAKRYFRPFSSFTPAKQ